MASIVEPSNDPVKLSVSPSIGGSTASQTSLSAPEQFVDIRYFPADGSGEVVIPATAHSLDGFREWALSDEFPDRGKIAFVAGGLIIDMSPESVEEHSEIKTEICRVLATLVRERKLGRLHIDGVLITVTTGNVSNEPDALFISRNTLKSGRLKFTPEKGRPQSSKEIVGPVDWVLEIVSPSSRRKDGTLLRGAYFKAGIPEYWLVDALGDEISFQILVPGNDGYVAMPAVDGWFASPAFEHSFRLTRDKDEDDLWQYTLHVKETS